MQSSTDIFSNLIAAYPTYDALKEHLTSLNIQLNAKDGETLIVCRYKRESADMTNPVVRAFRSVIWNSTTNRPVFVAPMKSESVATLPADLSAGYLVEDFVDGVMVNVFYDAAKATWRLATRSRLDADNKFYQHTFADLFNSAWAGLLGAAGFTMLNPALGYSFVLQHPANRVIVPVAAPCLTCVSVMQCDPATGAVAFSPVGPTMMPPRRFTVANTTELSTLLALRETTENFMCQGVVVLEVASNRRWKIRTPTYLAVRKLRGNHSRLEYTWFENARNGTLDAYLAFFPEDRAQAAVAAANYQRVVSEIYNWYVQVFKVRATPKTKIPPHFKGILFDLHGEYIKRLAPAKQSLTWKEHQSIMGRQDLKRMVFLTTFKGGAPTPAPAPAPEPAAAAAGGGGAEAPAEMAS
jgi:hypothetical protein